jgi:hypothetical protein
MDKSLFKTVKDLPIYSSTPVTYNSKELWVQIKKENNDFENAISSFRKSVCLLMQNFKSQSKNSIQFYEKNKNNLNKQLEYIRSETNIGLLN